MKKFNEEVEIIELDSGLELHIIEKKAPYQSTYCEVLVPFGSNNRNYTVGETSKTMPMGIAHFFEHKIFASPNGDHFEKLTELGASANAYTTNNRTAYSFSCVDKHVEILQEVLTMLQTPCFTAENVSKEQGIILEELGMYENQVNYQIEQELFCNTFNTHPVLENILGTKESILATGVKDLETISEDFYQMGNYKIILAGRVDKNKIIEMIESNFPLQKRTKLAKPIYSETLFVPVIEKTINLEVVTPKIVLGVKLPSGHNELEESRLSVTYEIANMLLFGKSSSLREELLESKLIDKSFGSFVSYDQGANILTLLANTTNPKLLATKLCDYLTSKDQKLVLADFTRIKKVYLGNFIFALNDLEHLVYLYGDFLFNQSSLYDVVDIVNEIRFEELVEATQAISREQIHVLTVMPKLKKS